MGRPEERAQNIPKILQDEFADQYDTLVLAIGGDQVQHLHWRLQHGELLHAARNNAEATFCILIGTNNIGSGMLPEHTVHGIIHFIDYMLEEVEGRLLVMKLLPRGDSFRLVNLCPPRCNNNGEPFASFTPAIRKVNQGIDDMVKARFKENKRIKLVDCGGAFEIENGDNEVNEILMPDKLHPNAKGHEKIAACIKNHLYSSSRGGD
jgi:lysophospholipase L1-like esterase